MNRKGFNHNMAISWGSRYAVGKVAARQPSHHRGRHLHTGQQEVQKLWRLIYRSRNHDGNPAGSWSVGAPRQLQPLPSPRCGITKTRRLHTPSHHPNPQRAPRCSGPVVSGILLQCPSSFFNLGLCWKQAQTRQVVRDGRIEPELEHAGTVETWVDFTGGSGVMDFYPVISKILDTSGTNAPAFCDAIDRIFPAEEARGFSRYPDKDTPAGVTYDTIRIARLLEAHMILRAHPGAEGLSSNVSDIMASGMGLDRPSSRSRFQIACRDVETFQFNTVNRGPHRQARTSSMPMWSPVPLPARLLGSIKAGIGRAVPHSWPLPGCQCRQRCGHRYEWGSERIGHMIIWDASL